MATLISESFTEKIMEWVDHARDCLKVDFPARQQQRIEVEVGAFAQKRRISVVEVNYVVETNSSNKVNWLHYTKLTMTVLKIRQEPKIKNVSKPEIWKKTTLNLAPMSEAQIQTEISVVKKQFIRDNLFLVDGKIPAVSFVFKEERDTQIPPARVEISCKVVLFETQKLKR